MKLPLLFRNLFLVCLFILPSQLIFAQKDTEFWFVAPYVTAGHGNQPVAFRLFTYEFESAVIISQPANPAFVPIEIIIPAFNSQTVELTDYLNTTMNSPHNTVLNHGYLITASNDISG